MRFMKHKRMFGILIFLLFFVFACIPQNEPVQKQATPVKDMEKDYTPKPVEGSAKSDNPTLIIASPENNGLIKSSKVGVELDAENFNIVPVGQPVKDNEGHFHVWLDSEKKVTAEKTAIFENVTSGKHVIVAELVKSDHSSLNPRVIETITINIESDYVPLQPVKQGSSEFTVEADDHGFYPNKIQAKIGDTVKINFKFNDDSIYYGGLDVKGPFQIIKYRLKGTQPMTAEFVMNEGSKITSYWPSSGVRKADLIVEVAK